MFHILTPFVACKCFNPFQNKPWFLRVSSTSLLKTLREKEKLLFTSNFSFSHIVFYLFGQLSAILIKLKIVVCKLVQFGRVQNLRFGKGLSFDQFEMMSSNTELTMDTIFYGILFPPSTFRPTRNSKSRN